MKPSLRSVTQELLYPELSVATNAENDSYCTSAGRRKARVWAAALGAEDVSFGCGLQPALGPGLTCGRCRRQRLEETLRPFAGSLLEPLAADQKPSLRNTGLGQRDRQAEGLKVDAPGPWPACSLWEGSLNGSGAGSRRRRQPATLPVGPEQAGLDPGRLPVGLG